MGNRQNCAKFQENLFRSNEIITIFCPPFFRKRPITIINGCFPTVVSLLVDKTV